MICELQCKLQTAIGVRASRVVDDNARHRQVTPPLAELDIVIVSGCDIRAQAVLSGRMCKRSKKNKIQEGLPANSNVVKQQKSEI